MEYHHLDAGDLAYGYEFKNMIEELGKDLNLIENKTERVCKKITALEFWGDCDRLNDAGKSLIEPFAETIKCFRKDVNLYFKQATNYDILNDLRCKSEAVGLDNKFAYFRALILSKKNGIDESLIQKILEEKLLPLYFVLQSKKIVVSLSSFFIPTF